MHLSAVRLEGIRNIGDLELKLDKRAPLVITGSAASGKTSLLEAILVAKYTFHPGAIEPESSKWLGLGRRSGMVELEWQFDNEDRAHAHVDHASVVTRWGLGVSSSAASLRFRELVQRVPVAYLDQARSLGGQKLQPNPMPNLLALKGRATYDWVERRLVELAEGEARRTVEQLAEHGLALATRDLGALRRFDQLLSRLCPRLRWGGTESIDGRVRPFFLLSNGRASSVDALSSSEKMAVLFAAVLDAFDVIHGLFLVDSPELWQHPSDHVGFFESLMSALSQTQVVAASTSAGLLRALPREQIVVIDTPAH